MERSLRTAAVRAGIDTDVAEGAVVPPIHLSTTYRFAGLREPRTFDYSRSGNPTRSLLADALAELDGAAGSVVTASGMGAITTVVLGLVAAGDVVVAPHDAYGGTWRLLDALSRRIGFDLHLFDLTAPDAAARVTAAAPTLLWVETPSNPLLAISDLTALGEAARGVGALMAVDNTFCSPVLQRPIALGADVVVQSSTKYLNGHSDVIGGVISAATPELAEQMRWWSNCLGVTGGAFDSYLTMRGLRTLGVRIAAHQANAAIVADALVAHVGDGVDRVHYPGLASHPGHELAARQMSGFGGIVSFELTGGETAVAAFVDGLEHFSLAESLGGVESLVCHPGSMTHAAMPADVQAAAGLRPGLVRLSVGIEDPADLVADLEAGLARASG